MTYLWDEKPEFPIGFTTDYEHYKGLIKWWQEHNDVWLEMLKVRYDILSEHSGRWLHFVAVDYPEIKEWISPQKIMEIMEKAEKYDEIQASVPLVIHLTFEQFVIEHNALRDKIEAINEWVKNELVMGSVNPPWYTKRIRQLADKLEIEAEKQ